MYANNLKALLSVPLSETPFNDFKGALHALESRTMKLLMGELSEVELDYTESILEPHLLKRFLKSLESNPPVMITFSALQSPICSIAKSSDGFIITSEMIGLYSAFLDCPSLLRDAEIIPMEYPTALEMLVFSNNSRGQILREAADQNMEGVSAVIGRVFQRAYRQREVRRGGLKFDGTQFVEMRHLKPALLCWLICLIGASVVFLIEKSWKGLCFEYSQPSIIGTFIIGTL